MIRLLVCLVFTFATLITAGCGGGGSTTNDAPVVTGAGTWKSIGPYGGEISALAIDPQTTTTLYAGSSGGMFKSLNGGDSWSPINSGLSRADINTIVVDPVTPSTLYIAGQTGGVFKSTNGGTTWTEINSGLKTTDQAISMAIDRTSTATVYVGTRYGGVFKSTDGGANWASAGMPAEFISVLVIDPATPTVIYVATSGGVFKSIDGGGSWNASNSGLPSSVHAVAIDPQNPSILYAGTWYDGIFKSTNGGGSWTKVYTHGYPGDAIIALAVDAAP